MNVLKREVLLTGVIAAVMVGGGAVTRAQEIGVMRMPSTIAQYFGYCYGAGHHVPIVRTPGYDPQRVHRMTVANWRYGPPAPAPYVMAPCGGHCDYNAWQQPPVAVEYAGPVAAAASGPPVRPYWP